MRRFHVIRTEDVSGTSGVGVVAEGVETREQLDFLRERLFNVGEGAGFGREELLGLLDSLGLSFEAIKNVGVATKEAAAQTQAEADAAKALEEAEKALEDARTAASDAADAAKAQADAAGSVDITNNFVIPYGDLEAIAGAVASRQAAQLGRRVRA